MENFRVRPIPGKLIQAHFRRWMSLPGSANKGLYDQREVRTNQKLKKNEAYQKSDVEELVEQHMTRFQYERFRKHQDCLFDK